MRRTGGKSRKERERRKVNGSCPPRGKTAGPSLWWSVGKEVWGVMGVSSRGHTGGYTWFRTRNSCFVLQISFFVPLHIFVQLYHFLILSFTRWGHACTHNTHSRWQVLSGEQEARSSVCVSSLKSSLSLWMCFKHLRSRSARCPGMRWLKEEPPPWGVLAQWPRAFRSWDLSMRAPEHVKKGRLSGWGALRGERPGTE